MVSQNIGNGTGLLYATDLAATKIISCTRNDAEGVRNMRTLGAGSAPIAAERSAVATVTFTAVGGAGNITAVTIAGVNQIGGNVAASVGDPTQTATDVAAAINAYTPGSGVDFVANSVAGVLYIYSTPSTGQATNGAVVTVSVSNVAITFTKTDFAGGSSEAGNTDSSVGLRFYLDPSPTASRTSFASAEEITKYIIVRGLQTGIVTKTLAVNTGRLTGIDRSCAITQVFCDTESSVATDDLAFIETVDFVEGDVVRLTQYVSGRVVTVYDASTSAGNIYLTNQSPFSCEDNKSIELRLQFDSVLGLIWIENGRSVSTGYITLSRVEARALATTGGITIGQTYNIYDVGDDGIVLTGITANLYSFDGEYIAVNPDYQNTSGDFESIWMIILPSVTIGKLYAYNGAMWQSLTGSVGSAPNTDAVNWLLIDKTDPRYVREIDFVQYDIDSNTVVRRTDKRGNEVVGNTAIIAFRWGDDLVAGNVILNASNNFMLNSIGQVTNNYVTGYIYVNNETDNTCYLNNSYITGGITINPVSGGWSLDRANISVNALLTFSLINSTTPSIIINESSSNLEITLSGYLTGTTLTLPEEARYASVIYINNDGSTIDTIDGTLAISAIPKTIKATQNTEITIQPTAKALATDWSIISDSTSPLVLTNVSTPITGSPTATDFCTIAYASLSIYYHNWDVINYKKYV
jgi:hypothetical protein